MRRWAKQTGRWIDGSMDWLDKGAAKKVNPGVLIRPGFDSLRSDARFQSLLRRIGLPQPQPG
jgi:hypothetical protein